MRAVAYSVKPFEKEFLAKANQKKHDITLISNSLSLETAGYAQGKEAVIVFTNDDVSAPVVNRLADMGVKYIATRSTGTDHIDREAAGARGMKISNVPAYASNSIAEHAVALAFALNRKLVTAASKIREYDFRLDNQVGFSFQGKTVGVIGMGNTGKATAAIFRGMGCHILGYDLLVPDSAIPFKSATLTEILSQSDIISLHIPLTPETRHLVCKDTLKLMKDGVMIINTARGELVDTKDMISALESGKVGYFGLDVYEFEKGLFFEDHRKDAHRDKLLNQLFKYPNVLVTAHQAFLTREALQECALKVISNMDKWQDNKCVGKACACANSCAVKEINLEMLP